jgi:alpha-glucuronidase
MHNGRTLWDELCYKYQEGVNATYKFQKIWNEVAPFIDKERFDDVQSKLKIQTKDAIRWKDACLLYFQTESRQPIPSEIEPPVYDLEKLKAEKPVNPIK